MISFKKQLLMLALVAGISVPVSAMDTSTDSSGWLGWKAVAGVTAVIGVATCAVLYKWLKTPKVELKVSDFVKLEEHEVEEDGFVLVESSTKVSLANSKPASSDELKLETQEDIKAALNTTDKEIAELEKDLEGQTSMVIVNRAKKPAAPKRTHKATGNPQAQVKQAPAKPAQPVKRVQGQSHGVTNQVLTATKLKKAGSSTTPAKK